MSQQTYCWRSCTIMTESVKQQTSLQEDIHVSVSPDLGENGGLQKIDTIRGDEAVRVLASYEGDHTWTPQEEKKLCRKIDFRLLPVLCITYAFLYADKVLLGQAVRVTPWLFISALTDICRRCLESRKAWI